VKANIFIDDEKMRGVINKRL